MTPVRALIAVVGPTGSGKSDLALRICEEFRGEAVNCDSLQLYRYFDAGTAKLSLEQRRGIPHHLLDILDPDEVFTAGEFARRARPLLFEISDRRRLPVVTGGTGFYLGALFDGLFAGPTRDENLRARLTLRETRTPGSLHHLLSRFDPMAAAAIHRNDTPKLIRALEILLLTRKPITKWFATGREPLAGFRILKIGLDPPRPALYSKLNARCAEMFAAGLVDEVNEILAKGFPASAKAFEALGYRQALQHLEGKLSLADAILSAQQATRRYAKRQLTWFRKDPAVEWLAGFGDAAEIQEAARYRVRCHIEAVETGLAGATRIERLS